MRSTRPVRWSLAGAAIVAVLVTGYWPASSTRETTGPRVSAAQAQIHIPVIPPQSTDTVNAFRSKIQHIVYILKENRSFDNYFGTYPGAEGATSGQISTGEVIPLGHTPDRTNRDLGHEWADAKRAVNNGRMDQFDLVQDGNHDGDMLSMTQLLASDIPNYWSYAEHFVLADHMFGAITGM